MTKCDTEKKYLIHFQIEMEIKDREYSLESYKFRDQYLMTREEVKEWTDSFHDLVKDMLFTEKGDD